MKRLVVFGASIIFLLFVNLVSAQEIIFDYPNQADYREVFYAEVKLINFSEDIYDIKIDIQGNGTRISKILNNGEWKTTYNYVIGAVDTSKSNEGTFSLNITENYGGAASIEVKVRDSSEKIKTFSGYNIQIIGKSEEESDDNKDDEENNNENNSQDENKPSIDLDWNNKDIINGEEFEIDLSGSNLENKYYDSKISIYNKDGKIISEIFDEEQDKWKSGQYYVNEILKGPDKSTSLRLRIKKDYTTFSGSTTIEAKIRESGSSAIIAEKSSKIKILEGGEAEDKNDNSSEEEKLAGEEKVVSQDSKKIEKTEEKKIIKLGNINTTKQAAEQASEKGKILYESKSEKIKKYSIYAMNILLIGILAFLLIRFKRDKNLED